ncbi:MAG: YccF domain-containing protein [Oscillospiraceae bacterium]|nr:YccF domain-containing protein [Oscillospiraceae bacterium]MBQ5357040.1 YccF domain-containing protein [Oscillospiraceae bacterium]MBQ5897639.1 YccF domain-containing protein [Oscillospiraceae bacterium]
MKTLGNFLWFVFGGFLLWLEWAAAGLLLCISIIGIPAGIQCFKIAGLCAFPFKKEIQREPIGFGNTFFNILWIIVFGWEIALTALGCGILWCITVVGIPFGKQFFKLAAMSLFPFGTKAVRN